jgi:uncharacterized protein with FMN-binding domain
MKRVIFAVLGTVAGLVALLDFKSHGQAITASGPLPSAQLPGTSSSGQANPASSPTSSPQSSRTSSPNTSARTVAGPSIETRYGVVQVQVTVSGGKIEKVKFLQLTAFDGRSAQINAAAAPTLLNETLDAQSAQIDAVSGATFTSDGYVQSLQSALDQAGVR